MGSPRRRTPGPPSLPASDQTLREPGPHARRLTSTGTAEPSQTCPPPGRRPRPPPPVCPALARPGSGDVLEASKQP
ncbi:formin-like protein 5 [Equus quagga]|uniref:formin-like protein 5 n=1 Tax=Equus quagga TaxID=89248 RepID=UPI001EE22333|nr:formin-like protein 5 [Equus quagga]